MYSVRLSNLLLGGGDGGRWSAHLSGIRSAYWVIVPMSLLVTRTQLVSPARTPEVESFVGGLSRKTPRLPRYTAIVHGDVSWRCYRFDEKIPCRSCCGSCCVEMLMLASWWSNHEGVLGTPVWEWAFMWCSHWKHTACWCVYIHWTSVNGCSCLSCIGGGTSRPVCQCFCWGWMWLLLHVRCNLTTALALHSFSDLFFARIYWRANEM